VAAAYERRSLGIASHSPFNEWGHFLPDETTAVSLIDRLLHHAVVVVTAGESFRMGYNRKLWIEVEVRSVAYPPVC